MYIGQASKKSGATAKAIRLYEELGLLSNIPRHNSYRVFTEEDILLIKFIKVAQIFDFKLSELKEIIYHEGSMTNWENIMKAILIKEQAISKEILMLQHKNKELKSYSDEIKLCLSQHSNCLFPQVKK